MYDPKAIAQSAGRLDLTSAPEGFDALVMADVARARKGLSVFIARDGGRASAFVDAMGFFAPEIEIVRFPSWDCLPYDRMGPSGGVAAQRMATLSRLVHGFTDDKPRLLVTQVAAALQRVPPRQVVGRASYLAKAGHEVTVIDRQAGPALETSFANAGEISPGYASPWAGPGIPAKAVRWLMMRHAPLILRPQLDLETVSWLWATLRNCTEARYARNKSRMVRLAEYSRDLLIDLRGATGIAYDERSRGTLQLFRTQAQMDGVA